MSVKQSYINQSITIKTIKTNFRSKVNNCINTVQHYTYFIDALMYDNQVIFPKSLSTRDTLG